MASKILQTIVDGKIERFKREFCSEAPAIFEDENSKLIHPGEFGMYREEVCRDFLKIFLPKDREIADGFVIDSSGGISKQTDIIIYDKVHTPIFTDDKNQKFFPVETVAAVGEIKSNLDKSTLEDTIQKLVNIKKQRCLANVGVVINRNPPNTNPPDTKKCLYDQLFSFIICRKFSFDISKWDNATFYKNIEPHLRPNLILSIDDGLIGYWVEEDQKFLYYPFFRDNNVGLGVRIKKDQKYIQLFGIYLFSGVMSATIFYPELVNYIYKDNI